MNYYKKLLDYLPSYERGSKVMQEIYKSIGLELAYYSNGLSDFINQLFLDKATWGLDFWEDNLGLEIKTNLSYERRRQIIKSRLRGYGKLSDLLLESVIKGLTGGDLVDVTFLPEGIINIELNTKGMDSVDIQKIISEVDLLKPIFYVYKIELNFENVNSSLFVGSNNYFSEHTTINPYFPNELWTYGDVFIGVCAGHTKDETTIYPKEEMI